MSASMQGFRGWLRGVAKALDTWEGKLGNDVPEDVTHDIQTLRSTLDAMVTGKVESLLRGLGVQVNLTEGTVKEDVTVGDTTFNLSDQELAVLGMLAAKGSAGVDEEMFTARDQRTVKILATKHLAVYGDSGKVSVSDKGLALYKRFAKAILREGGEELLNLHREILAEVEAPAMVAYDLYIPSLVSESDLAEGTPTDRALATEARGAIEEAVADAVKSAGIQPISYKSVHTEDREVRVTVHVPEGTDPGTLADALVSAVESVILGDMRGEEFVEFTFDPSACDDLEFEGG